MNVVKSAYIVCLDKKNKTNMTIYGSRVIFKTSGTMGQTPNTLSVKVYGVDGSDTGSLFDKAHTVELYAGRRGEEGLLGSGQIVSAKMAYNQDGEYLDIVAVDGDDFFVTPVNMSISGGVTLEDLTLDLIRASGTSVQVGQISPKSRGVALPRGLAIVGSPIHMIRNVAKAINASFYVNQGLVYMICPEEMIGEKIIIEEEKILSNPVYDGYYMTLVVDIDFNIRVGKNIVLPETKADAPTYRVLRVETQGDTKNPGWRMIIEGAEQTESGFAQSAITNSVWR